MKASRLVWLTVGGISVLILATFLAAVGHVGSHPAPEGLVQRPLATHGPSQVGVFSPDGHILMTGGEQGIASWDVTTWMELGFIATTFPVLQMAFSSDGAKLAFAGNDRFQVLDVASGTVSSVIEIKIAAISFEADNHTLRIFSRGINKGELTAWDSSTGTVTRTVYVEDPVEQKSPVTFNANGARIAFVSGGKVRTADAETGQSTGILNLGASDLRDLQFSPDGAGIAAVYPNKAQVALASDGRVVHEFTCGSDDKESLRATFSRDGARVALACGDEAGSSYGGRVHVFDMSGGKPVYEFADEFQTDKPAWASFSPDGAKLAAPMHVWDARTPLETQRGDALEPMENLEFSPDETRIVGLGGGIGGNNMSAAAVRGWNAGDGREIGRFPIPTEYPGTEGGSFSQDLKKVLAVDRAHGGRVFSMPDGRPLYELPIYGFFSVGSRGSKLSRDASRILTWESSGGNHGHSAYVWDAQSGRQLHKLDLGYSNSVSGTLSPNGMRWLAFVVEPGVGIHADLWDVTNGARICQFPERSWANQVQFSDDSEQVFILLDNTNEPKPKLNFTAEIRDGATCRLVRSSSFMAPGEFGYTGANFAPDGSAVAVVGSSDGRARVFDTASGALKLTLEGHLGRVNGVSFSNDGTLLVTAGSDHTVRLWDAREGKTVHVWEGPQDPLRWAHFSNGARRVLAYTKGNRIWLFDTDLSQGIELQQAY